MKSNPLPRAQHFVNNQQFVSHKQVSYTMAQIPKHLQVAIAYKNLYTSGYKQQGVGGRVFLLVSSLDSGVLVKIHQEY